MNNWTKSKSAFFIQDRVFAPTHKYPPHWKTLLVFLSSISNITNVYDIGCGSGSYFKIIDLYFHNIKYTGYDISEYAIDVAKNGWSYDNFFVADYNDIPKLENLETSAIIANGLIEVVDDPAECLSQILDLSGKFCILQRMLITEKNTYTTTHNNAYDITINESRININEFENIISKNYNIKNMIMLEEYCRPNDDIFYYDYLLERK